MSAFVIQHSADGKYIFEAFPYISLTRVIVRVIPLDNIKINHVIVAHLLLRFTF